MEGKNAFNPEWKENEIRDVLGLYNRYLESGKVIKLIS